MHNRLLMILNYWLCSTGVYVTGTCIHVHVAMLGVKVPTMRVHAACMLCAK